MTALFSAELVSTPRRRRVAAALVPVQKSVVFGSEPRGQGESAAVRVSRLRVESRVRFHLKVCDSIHAKLGLLAHRNPDEVLRCPLARITACTAECRCGGTGVMTLGEQKKHYEGLLAFMWSLTPKPKRRRQPERITIP